jgi:hypothetical protein
METIELITTFAKVFLFTAICIWILIMIYKGIKKSKSTKYQIRYGLFKKKFDEDVVKECFEFIEVNKDVNQQDLLFKFNKKLLLDGKYKDVDEVLYIFNQIQKLKGVKKNVKGIRKSIGKAE